MKEILLQWAEDHVRPLGLLIGVLLGVGVIRFWNDVAPWIVGILLDIAGQK